jgi:hypothetical protein
MSRQTDIERLARRFLCAVGVHIGKRGLSWSWKTGGGIDPNGNKFLRCIRCGQEKTIDDEPGGLQIYPDIPNRVFFKAGWMTLDATEKKR